MFRITEDPSSGNLVQCFAKNYKNDSIVSVDMDVVGVMAAYSDPLFVCVCMKALRSYSYSACSGCFLYSFRGHCYAYIYIYIYIYTHT